MDEQLDDLMKGGVILRLHPPRLERRAGTTKFEAK
jgi:hypothetical protein